MTDEVLEVVKKVEEDDEAEDVREGMDEVVAEGYLLVGKHSGQTEGRTRLRNRGRGANSGCDRDRDSNGRINYRSGSSLGSVS